MSEPSGDKPFKTLKLTSFKSAKAAPVSGESSPVAPGAPAVPEIGGTPSEGSSVAPASVPEVTEAKASAEPTSLPAATSKVGGSMKMMSLKVGAPSRSPAAETPSAATTPPPELSRPAASAGPAVPFKVLTPAAKTPMTELPAAAPATRPGPAPIVTPIAKSSDVVETPPHDESPAFATKLKVATEVVTPSVNKSSAPLSPGKSGSKKPLIFAGVGILALVVAGGVLFVTGIPGSPHEDAPVKRLPESGPAETPGTKTGIVTPTPVAPVEKAPSDEGMVVHPGEDVIDPTAAPKTRRPELDTWLERAAITTVTTQRITINNTVYSLNAAVNPEGTLRWIGRDSATRDLLFIDDAGVIYTRAAGAAGSVK